MAIKYTAPSSKTTGISSAALASGANLLSSAVNNSTDRNLYADIELTFAAGATPTADEVIEIYILEAIDGSNFEDGGTSVDPKGGTLIGTASAYADTSTHRRIVKGVTISPGQFKILIKSEIDQSATVTLTVKTYAVENV